MTARSGIELLPFRETVTPTDAGELCAVIRGAHETETPIYPVGGGTSLDFGLPAKRTGLAVQLTGLARVVDYPARDMTITVEAGITMHELSQTLANERQQLPIDVPSPTVATLGGVVATNWNGPRRYGAGTVRDYVIGVSAVDGRGDVFRGGGRVVKNVAGYDFCKLLTGSLGTIGVIAQLTLKLKPIPERSAFAVCPLGDWNEAERALTGLASSETTPAALELLSGEAWDNVEGLPAGTRDKPVLVVLLEGTDPEVTWMTQQLADEWRQNGLRPFEVISSSPATQLWNSLAGFPSAGDSPLVLKASIVPSGTVKMITALRAVDPRCSIQAHAGNGIVLARLHELPASGLSRTLIARLQPAAAACRGSLITLSNPGRTEMTHPSVWGPVDAPVWLMNEIKRRFDPKDILNPGRFVYFP